MTEQNMSSGEIDSQREARHSNDGPNLSGSERHRAIQKSVYEAAGMVETEPGLFQYAVDDKGHGIPAKPVKIRIFGGQRVDAAQDVVGPRQFNKSDDRVLEVPADIALQRILQGAAELVS
jgi:hypothetical protein